MFLWLQIFLVLSTFTFTSVAEQWVGELPCEEIEASVRIQKEITKGRVKRLFYGSYKSLPVVLCYPRDHGMKDDFQHGLDMLLAFQNSKYVPELIGYCRDMQNLKMVTRFSPYGSLDRLDEILSENSYHEFQKRLQLVNDYLDILEYLHDGPLGKRVMCDSNDLEKTLSQYLINDDFRLLVNDLDALPEIKNGNKIKCGKRQIFGDFVAPEQLWPYNDIEFDDSKMPGYDEKTDVWKVPDVLMFILGRSSKASQIKFRLFDIFSRCKNVNPDSRPTVTQIKEKMEEIMSKFEKGRNIEL